MTQLLFPMFGIMCEVWNAVISIFLVLRINSTELDDFILLTALSKCLSIHICQCHNSVNGTFITKVSL